MRENILTIIKRVDDALENIVPYCDELQSKEKKIIAHTMLEAVIVEEIASDIESIAATSVLYTYFTVNSANEAWYGYLSYAAEAINDSMSHNFINANNLPL